MKDRNFLEYYYKKYKQPFRIQTFRKEPRKWINYKGEEDEDFVYYSSAWGTPNHREPLPAEIVMDIDYHVPNITKEKEERAFKTTLMAIEEKLKELNLTYSLWHSGGNGYHFHLFFNELAKYPRFQRTELKRFLLRHMAYGYLTFHEDKAKVDSPVMITIENAFSRKGKKKKLIRFVNNGDNKIPQEVMIKYDVNKNLEKYVTKPTYSFNGEPKSIKFFLSSSINSKDGKKRACFVLASWFAQQGLTRNEIFSKLYEWNEYTMRGYLPEKTIRTTISGVLKSKSRVSSRYRNQLLDDIGAREFKDET